MLAAAGFTFGLTYSTIVAAMTIVRTAKNIAA
jgi:hypothetical protein